MKNSNVWYIFVRKYIPYMSQGLKKLHIYFKTKVVSGILW